MSALVDLVREFLVGAFLLLISFIWMIERVGVALADRNKPQIISRDCDCYEEGEKE